jgi:hypothetical protein
MLAAELALARVDVAIVERRESQDLPDTRAGGLHARTIEVLDQRGVAERFISEGKVMQVAGFAWGVRPGEKGINALAKLEDGKRVRLVLIEPPGGQGLNIGVQHAVTPGACSRCSTLRNQSCSISVSLALSTSLRGRLEFNGSTLATPARGRFRCSARSLRRPPC